MVRWFESLVLATSQVEFGGGEAESGVKTTPRDGAYGNVVLLLTRERARFCEGREKYTSQPWEEKETTLTVQGVIVGERTTNEGSPTWTRGERYAVWLVVFGKG
jgi:hypothetical protein